MDKRKLFWYLIAIGVSILFFLIVLSSIIDVGERLGRISQYLEYLFYGLSAILIYVLVINPVRIIVFAPAFSIATVLEEDKYRNYKIYKKVRKNIIANNNLSEIDEKNLIEAITYDELQEALASAFKNSVRKELNKIITRNAKTVMISTAISQNGKLDMFTVVAVNLKMIKELVLKCGFRPSMKNLSKLTINVFTTALIAEGLENMNLDEVLPSSTTNALSEIPLIKPLISSFTQGISNALLTIRIGIVTRKYLFADGKTITRDEIRIQALKESLKLLPLVVKEVMMIFPNRVVRFFTKKEKQTDE